ncbi:MAG: hypothetical protein AAFU69_00200 [Pseudomonadota bacterium]
MRCSVCFAEVTRTKDALECDTQDCPMKALVEEHGELPDERRARPKVWALVALLAVAAFAISALIWGQTLLQEAQKRFGQSDLETSPGLETAMDPRSDQDLVLNDDASIILSKLSMISSGSTLFPSIAKPCHTVRSEVVPGVQWRTPSGEPLHLTRPQLPGNWQVSAACYLPVNQTVFASTFEGGASISKVGADDRLLWTQILSSSQPQRDEIAISIFEETLIAATFDAATSQVKLASIDQDGAQNWTVSLPTTASIDQLLISQNGFGDVLAAWQEEGGAIRLATIARSGVVLQDVSTLAGAAELITLMGDELGRTLIVSGERESVMTLISASGETDWQKTLNANGRLIGALAADQGFYLFSFEGAKLLISGVSDDGQVSDPIEVEFKEEIVSASMAQINVSEAMATFEFAGDMRIDITIDLRRVSNSLSFASPGLSLPDLTLRDALGEEEPIEPNAAPDPDTSPTDTPPEDQGANGPDTLEGPDERVESVESPESLDRDSEARFEETQPEVTEDQPAIEESTPPEPASEVFLSDEGSVSETTLSSETEPALVSSATCTFTCRTLSPPIIDYVLQQTVDLEAGETLDELPSRLIGTYENLCEVSGGRAPEGREAICS